MGTFTWTTGGLANIDPQSIFSNIVGDDLHPEGTRSIAHLFRTDRTVLELEGSGMSKFPSPSGTPGQGPWLFNGTVVRVLWKSSTGDVLADITFERTSISTFCGSQQSPPYSQTYNADALQILLSGADTIRDSGGANHVLNGFAGADFLDAADGNDLLIGGQGDDRFIYAPGYGSDTIADFVAGAATDDKIDLTALGGVHSLADVRARMSQVGSDVLIDFGNGDTLTLQNVQQQILAADDFIFGAAVEGFGPPRFALSGFGADRAAGSWISGDKFPRTVADVNGDGRADIVGFGEMGTSVALAQADGNFGTTFAALNSFGSAVAAGGWSSDGLFHRTLGDVNGDGREDIVGFGGAGTYVALANAAGTFQRPLLAIASFGADAAAGGWSSDTTFPREVGDVNGDGRADIVGFGSAGVYVALGSVDGTFQSPILAINSFGSTAAAGGWVSDDLLPRTIGDVNGDGRADIVGFGTGGVFVSLATSSGTFQAPIFALNSFGSDATAGGWSSDGAFPRVVADVNDDGRADIVGFGGAGTYLALGRSDGTFASPSFKLASFGADAVAGGWSSNNIFPRALGDINGDGSADIIGFGGAGVYTALANDFVFT